MATKPVSVLYNQKSCLRGEVDIMRPSEGRVTGSIPVGGANFPVLEHASAIKYYLP